MNKQFHPYIDRPMILVSGLGRSGTTVLRNCVAAHPELDARNQESNYIGALSREAFKANENSSISSNLPVDENVFWQSHRQIVLDLNWPDAYAHPNSKKALATYSNLEPIAAIGFTKVFPNSSICYIVRNGIEVVSSYQLFNAFEHMTFESCCELWRNRYSMVEFCRDLEQATLIRYEWLQNSKGKFQNVLSECFSKVGIEFSEKCLKPLSKIFHPTKSVLETKAESKDLNARKDRWKNWSDEERVLFKNICGETMAKLDYEIPY